MIDRLANGIRFLILLPGLLLCGPLSAQGAPDTQTTEGFVNAPVATVWKLFTTPEGYKTLGVSQAEIDLRIGGLIRSRAAPGGILGDPDTLVTEILAYEPERLLALRIRQAPAAFPHREAMATLWTVIYFTPSGADMTHVRMVGLGYGGDTQSRALQKFFAEANRATLDQAAKRYWPKCKLCAAETPPTAE